MTVVQSGQYDKEELMRKTSILYKDIRYCIIEMGCDTMQLIFQIPNFSNNISNMHMQLRFILTSMLPLLHFFVTIDWMLKYLIFYV